MEEQRWSICKSVAMVSFELTRNVKPRNMRPVPIFVLSETIVAFGSVVVGWGSSSLLISSLVLVVVVDEKGDNIVPFVPRKEILFLVWFIFVINRG